MDFDQFLDSTSKVKARRGQSLTEREIILLRNIFLARHNS